MPARYADVIVDITHADVDRVFTYGIPAGMDIVPGTRVSIPFGRQTTEGFVIGVKDAPGIDPDKIKDINAPLEEYPAILPQLIDLAQDMSAQTHCPLAATLRLMVPAQMRGGRIKVKTEKAAQLLVAGDALEDARKAQSRAPKRRLLLDLLSDGEVYPVSELAVLVRQPLEGLRALEQQGFVRVIDQEVLRSPYPDDAVTEPDPVLTAQQQEVLGELLPAVRSGTGQFLLYGVTGSGKTEVYIRAVHACLEAGKGAIVLIPEIVLTPQMVTWFRARFGDVAAVLHSRLSAGERFDEWRRIRRGKARVVIGARSAVFAPVDKLGILIVDEEHEGSYLSEHAPSYDAREVALSRAMREDATLLLASATPSVLSFARASRGDMMLLEMPRRVNDRPLPQVTLVDMREELRLGNKGIFSQELVQALTRCLDSGQQAMLFLNRRGYAPSVVCRKCGHVMGCPDCDVSLTYHAQDRSLHCHYCGLRLPMPGQCPECQSRYIRSIGIGTQKVEEEVAKLFPGVPLVRMDNDTTQGKDGHRTLLNRFRSGEARVMIGTQMIAKGLDFPQVTLVGVVLADLSVNLPDYRSAERTFQLLTQVAGRAGRADLPGEVVIQTYKPEHYAIAAAAQQDYRSFYHTEFARRRRDLYPPFTMMVRLLCQAKDEAAARSVSKRLLAHINELFVQYPQLRRRMLFIREDDAPIKRLMGRARAQVLMKLLVHRDSDRIIEHLTDLSRRDWPCDVTLEINPASMA